jgi:hypothetical protein
METSIKGKSNRGLDIFLQIKDTQNHFYPIVKSEKVKLFFTVKIFFFRLVVEF